MKMASHPRGVMYQNVGLEMLFTINLVPETPNGHRGDQGLLYLAPVTTRLGALEIGSNHNTP